MRSLNEIYAENRLYYWCNASGDINVPYAARMDCGTMEDLPQKQQELYEKCWTEGAGCYMYVVSYCRKPGIVLGFLFDRSYMKGLLGKKDESDFTADDSDYFFDCICKEATKLEKDFVSLGFKREILVGKDTDPDGHELLVFIPYEQCFNFDSVTAFADSVYRDVDRLAKRDGARSGKTNRVICVIRGGMMTTVYSGNPKTEVDILDYDNFNAWEEGSEEYEGYRKLEQEIQNDAYNRVW